MLPSRDLVTHGYFAARCPWSSRYVGRPQVARQRGRKAEDVGSAGVIWDSEQIVAPATLVTRVGRLAREPPVSSHNLHQRGAVSAFERAISRRECQQWVGSGRVRL